jgi:hypothetical protein
MLKLYTNTSFLNETYRKSVFPLLFDLHFLKDNVLLQYYEIVETIEASDIVIFPIDYAQFLNFRTAFLSLQKEAKANNKPIWIYTGGDYGFTNYIKNSYTFRLGGFDSKLDDNSFVIPSFINDPYRTQLTQEFRILPKEVQPSIGFVGHAQAGFVKYCKEFLNHLKYKTKRKLNKLTADSQSFYPSSTKRAKYLGKLNLSENLNTNFMFRNSYRAGVQTEANKQKTTQEFYDNIYNNAYTFCIRGVGNFSVRFYETLAVGRIPIVLNTDCRLPLPNTINWEDHCVLLDENKKQSLETQILEFHNSKTEEAFEAIQKNNRELWESHLVRQAYFKTIYNIFKTE